MRDISWRTRRFAMRIDPSVILCMLSRALRSLPLVSERSLPLLPTCTLIFFFQVCFNVDSSLRCGWASRELHMIDLRIFYASTHHIRMTWYICSFKRSVIGNMIFYLPGMI